MRKLITTLILALFLMSTMAAASKGVVGTAKPTKYAQGLGQAPDTAGTAPNTRLGLCVKYLSDKPYAETPAKTCQRIIDDELKCEEYLKEHGADDPETVCKRFRKQVRRVLPENIRAQATKSRLRNLERAVQQNPDAEGIINKLPEDKAKILAMLPRAQQKHILQMSNEDVLKKLSAYKIKIVPKEERFKKRVIAKNRLENARQNYQKAKERYLKARQNYKNRMQKFKAAREKLKECKDVQSEECDQIRAEVQENAKQAVINSGEALIEHLNKLLEKVNSAEDMDADTADKIKADLEQAISDMNAALEDAKAATTKEEIKAAANKIAQTWKGVRHRERLHAARLVHAKVWNIIKRSEHLEERLDAALAKLDERGYDTTALNEKVDQFSSTVADAKSLFDEARELLSGVTTPGDPASDDLAKQARDKLKEAEAKIKEAHELLKEIVKDIREAGGAIPEEPEQAEEVSPDNNETG